MIKNHDKNDDHDHEMLSVVVIHLSNHDHDHVQMLDNFSVRIDNGHLWFILTPYLAFYVFLKTFLLVSP